MPTANRARTRPASARRDPLPDHPALMLCTLVAEPFDNPNWVFEPKLDGLRVWCRCDGRRVTMLSRNEKPQDLQFPEVRQAVLDSLGGRTAVLDGEIVCLDERGRSSFRRLQQRFHIENELTVRRRMLEYPAFLYVFDVLYLDGRDVTALPLSERKVLLRDAVKWSDRVRWTQGTPNGGTRLLRQACRDAEEGIVGKDARSPYVAGRAAEWVKIKCSQRQEFVIGGWTDPQRTRIGLGALLVGYYDESGKFTYAGKVGTGYTSATLRDLRGRLGRIARRDNPFQRGKPPGGEQVHWVKPRLIAEIGFGEWTQHALLRHPRFEGLRMDKDPKTVRRERPKSAPTRTAKRRADTAADGASAARATETPGASLADYERKRDFARTPEPPPKVARSKGKPVFVIQEHHATRLHYDLRLEADGVLKSWAVTREPSSDPAVKRLAVRTEDHPLAYAGFRGDIPKGEHGAGHMETWDTGTYEPPRGAQDVAAGLAAGKVEFELRGERLKGAYALVRMKGRGGGDNWLLIKKKDRFAASEPSAASNGKAKSATASGKPPARRKGGGVKPVARGTPQDVEFTHVEKVMFPDAGLTKGDVLKYYLGVADVLLPHLRDRPVTLERLPDGVGEGKPRFWQKNTPTYYPKWIPRVELPTGQGKPVQYALVNDAQTLAYLVNQGAVTFHTYLSRVLDLDRPDYVVYDFDPGSAKFTDVVRLARGLHEVLDDQRVKSFPKTSGKSGLHVVVPWTQPGGYDEARGWAMAQAEKLVAEFPKLATVERLKDKRDGRIYVDVIQNAAGHHVVPPYVLRAIPRATVSTPLDWKEVTPKLNPARFTAAAVLARLGRGKDPMRALGNGKD